MECEDNFYLDTHFRQINFKKALIKVNKDMPDDLKKDTICHEMVHGILVHIGRNDMFNDETFVQTLGNTIAQGFEIKVEE